MTDLPHKIERSRNRTSRAFLRDDLVVIRLAKNLSRLEEQRHIDTLLRRMATIAVKEQSRHKIDPFRPLLEGQDEVQIDIAEGGSYRFSLKPGIRTVARKKPDGWAVTVGPRTGRRALHLFLWKLLAQSEMPIMDARIHELNARTLQVPITKTSLRFATSQWGSCSHGGRIMLNTALLFTDEELLNYVVIHELAHRIHRNHSKAFWKLVESAMPDYKDARKKLRNFRITRL